MMPRLTTSAAGQCRRRPIQSIGARLLAPIAGYKTQHRTEMVE
jgi:hypothetical protein